VREYSKAFKSKMVQRMAGPGAVSANALAADTGIPQPTLSRWLKEAQDAGHMKPRRPSTEPNTERRPADWPPEERLRVVMEASRLRDQELGEFLRREGLHEATLTEWRAAALEALSPQRKAPAESKRVRELEKELRRKDKALAETAALLVLQKKIQAIWGDGDDDTDPKKDG
jgi:transposase-like protein